MSGFTKCNYCTLQSIKRSAEAEGKKVLMIPSNYGGVNVFVVPKEVSKEEVASWKDCDECPPNGDENHQKYFAAWLMGVTEVCCC